MHRACVKVVGGLGTSFVKLYSLSPQSTVLLKYLTSQVFFIRSFYYRLLKIYLASAQRFLAISYLFPLPFSTLSTPLNNEAI